MRTPLYDFIKAVIYASAAGIAVAGNILLWTYIVDGKW